jgi:hypothetical protein
VGLSNNSSEEVAFPTRATIEKWGKVLHTLTGVENGNENGRGSRFRWILSNGTRSNQTDKTFYDHMMPEGSHKKIRSVEIYHYTYGNILGFMFYDKEGALLWRIGICGGTDINVKTVLVAENEVIIGVVGKMH